MKGPRKRKREKERKREREIERKREGEKERKGWDGVVSSWICRCRAIER